MNEKFSPVAVDIIQGLKQAIQCEQYISLSTLHKKSRQFL